MEVIKSVSRSRQISLGKIFAGQRVVVDQIEAGVWIVKVGQFVPNNEQWLHQSKARTEIDAAVAWAKKNPPRKSDLKVIESRLKKMNPATKNSVLLDLNNPVFQRHSFSLIK